MEQDPNPGVRLTFLFRLVIAQKATPAQKEELMLLMADKANEAKTAEILRDAWEGFDFGQAAFTASESEQMLRNILSPPLFEAVPVRTLPKRVLWRRYMAVAAGLLLLFVAGGYWLMTQNTPTEPVVPETVIAGDLPPGSNKAILSLANGKEIALDDAPIGVLARLGAVEIRKSEEGSVVYGSMNALGTLTQETEYHTVSTPRGGKYKVVLPDGTLVWLNAASSIRYPSKFTDSERVVEVAGEAYLEVNPVLHPVGDQKIPFKVIAGNQHVEVLGTHFNINSYEDEALAKTTLLEGSIRITGKLKGKSLLLQAGQQCSVSHSGDIQVTSQADLEEAIAWKEDLFKFQGADIQNIMRQVARWYNVDVQYEGAPPVGHMTGYISRQVPISGVLGMLEQTSDLTFRLKGRQVLVSSLK